MAMPSRFRCALRSATTHPSLTSSLGTALWGGPASFSKTTPSAFENPLMARVPPVQFWVRPVCQWASSTQCSSRRWNSSAVSRDARLAALLCPSFLSCYDLNFNQTRSHCLTLRTFSSDIKEIRTWQKEKRVLLGVWRTSCLSTRYSIIEEFANWGLGRCTRFALFGCQGIESLRSYRGKVRFTLNCDVQHCSNLETEMRVGDVNAAQTDRVHVDFVAACLPIQ